jgi:parallel beta helix pectate lyase-like protein
MKFRTKLTFGAAALWIAASLGVGLAPSASATTYYVSSSVGSDDNDGQSPERAWEHLSNIFLKAYSKDGFHPGDSILLKRGDLWDGQIRLRANGTEQKPILIGAYGEGAKPLLYGDNPQLRWESIENHLGIYAADMGKGSVLGSLFVEGKSLRAIYPVGPLSRREYMDALLTEVQSGTFAGQFDGRLWVRMLHNHIPNNTVRVFRSAGVMLADSSYIQIENLEIRRFYTGIDITASSSVRIRHNDIQDVLGIGVYLRSEDRDCLVESNTIFRSGNTALYVLKGRGNTFRDNWVSRVDTRILGLPTSGDKMGIGLQESLGTLVEYNYFSRSGGMDFYHEQDSVVRYNFLDRVRSAGSPNGDNLLLYGNIYSLGGSWGERGSTGINVGITGPGTIAVFNNTIVNARAYSLMGSSSHGGRIIFSDNIASSAGGDNGMTVFGSNVISSHNCFFSSGDPSFGHFSAKFSSLPTYQAESGLDRDSIFADPQFLDPAARTPLGFRLKANSRCNSPASNMALPDLMNGRTYDHDLPLASVPVMGALRVDRAASSAARFEQSCTSECLEHTFKVGKGVYLVRLTFAPQVLERKSIVAFALNGRNVVAEFDSSASGDPEGALLRYFLVRPEGPCITLEAAPGTDSHLIAGVDVSAFDTGHGTGPQIIPW